MPHFFLYARKSSEDDDRQVASIPAQVAELRANAESRGIVITRTFEESQSAKAPGRPIFDQMMREARQRGSTQPAPVFLKLALNNRRHLYPFTD